MSICKTYCRSNDVIRSMIAGLTLHVLPVSKTAVDFIEAKMNFLALVPMQLQHALQSPVGISNLKKVNIF